jgi:hypothetical protein
MSIVTVFTVLFLTMLLGMVMNSGREVDGKIRMQNAADAAAYSGGVVIARGYNTLAFSNHLLSDVFALTAFMREARDRNSEKHVSSILSAWNRVAPRFAGSPVPRLRPLAEAIPMKVALEQEVVLAFGDWGAATSARVLPVLEQILREEMIPEFERAVVQAYPEIAQMAASEAASRNGQPDRGRGTMLAMLWRTTGVPVGGSDEVTDSTFPVVDPEQDVTSDQADYLDTARGQRRDLATRYLHDWNDQALAFFDREVKMCQYANLWRSFTCGYLEDLLEKEYPRRNLPHVMREFEQEGDAAKLHLEQYHTLVAVVYWKELPTILPALFRSPTQSDSQAFAAVRIFVPTPRLVWQSLSASRPTSLPIGGMPGDFPDLSPSEPSDGESGVRWIVGRQSTPVHWDLLNQHWTAQLVPASTPKLAAILQTEPPLPDFFRRNLRLPKLGDVSSDEIGRINAH